MKRRSRIGKAFVAFVEAVVISATLMFLAEYFGWPVFREAGGGIVSASDLP
jgi:hypothetical protein